MQTSTKTLDENVRDLRSLINADAAELSTRLRAQQLRDFPPAAQKTIRRFSPAEAARFIGIAEGYLRQLVSEGKGPPAPRCAVTSTALVKAPADMSHTGATPRRCRSSR